MAIAFFMGLAAAMAQVVLIRELMVLCRGNELIIGVIFSSWFLGLYLGARFNPEREGSALGKRVLLSMVILPLALALSVYGAHGITILIPRTVGTFYSFSSELLLALLFTAPVSFFVGFFFPPLVSLASGEMKESSGGTVFYTESLGSFTGGMVFSFVLVTIANPLAIAMGLFSISLAALFWLIKKKLIPLALVPLAIMFFSGAIENRIFTEVWNRTHTGTLLHYQRTRYQTVAVERAAETVSVYGDGILLYSLPDRYESRGLFHLVNALREERGNVLLMGSGPGSLLHNLLNTGIGRLRYVEHDPELWDAVRPFMRKLYPPENGRVLSVVRQDLRHYLTDTPERFDMIINLPPAPDNIMVNRFYTGEFYGLCKKRLSKNGIFITALHGFSNYMAPDTRNFIASMYRAFASEFPDHLRTSGETIFLIGAAEKGVLPGSGEALMGRYGKKLPLPGGPFEEEVTGNFSPEKLRAFFEKSQLDYFGGVMAPLLKTIDENRDLQPGAYWKNIILMAFREGSVMHGLVRGGPVLLLLVALLGAVVLWDVRRRHGPAHLAAGFMIYSTGLISMSLMLIMIVLYQNAHGIVYYRISLINAMFMAGLTAGSFAATRWSGLGLRVVLPGIAVAAAMILASTWTASDLLFWPLLLLFSFLCGAVFPALFRTMGQGSPLAAASVLDALDHFGAIAGSLLTVMVFLPLAGIRGTLILVIAIALPPIVLSFILPRGRGGRAP